MWSIDVKPVAVDTVAIMFADDFCVRFVCIEFGSRFGNVKISYIVGMARKI